MNNKIFLFLALQSPQNMIPLLNSRFFCTVLPRAGVKHPTVKDELFDAFAVDNYIEKYCLCKQ